MSRPLHEGDSARRSEIGPKITSLVVTRRLGQSVIIAPEQLVLIGKGRAIEVTFLEVDGMQVRLRFQAPEDVRVMRKELLTSKDGH